jgi:hypothetical protein
MLGLNFPIYFVPTPIFLIGLAIIFAGVCATYFSARRRKRLQLSEEAIQRLARLGYAGDAELTFWRKLLQSEGESFFWGFLRKEEEAAGEYRRWYPRLQAFAAECRQAVPVPAVDSFSAIEREQYRVLFTKMHHFAVSKERKCIGERKPNYVAILATTRVGLSAAQQVFGNGGALLLQTEERERWFSEIYPVDHEKSFSWWAFAWWNLTEGLAGEDEASIRRHYPIPEGCSYWVVESGVQWSGLAGWANYELWRWDGKQAEFIELYRFWMC